MTRPILLFAAGKGTRMAPLTNHMPKPLIRVGGRTLFDHAYDFAKAAGCAPVVVNTHYLAGMLRDHLAGRDILFSDESDLLRETGGGLRHALPLLGQDIVITMNTDAVWHGPNPVELLLSAWRPGMEALVLTVAKPNVRGHLGAGDFDLTADGRIQRGRDLIYTGLQIIRTERLAKMTEDVFSMNAIWDQMITSGGLYGTTYDGQWCDVGQPESIPLAEAMCHV